MTTAAVPTLPTIKNLEISPLKDVEPVKIAGEWPEKFQTAIPPSPNGDVDINKVLDLFQSDDF